MPNHKARMAIKVVKGMAAELPQAHKKRFNMKKMTKTVLTKYVSLTRKIWTQNSI